MKRSVFALIIVIIIGTVGLNSKSLYPEKAKEVFEENIDKLPIDDTDNIEEIPEEATPEPVVPEIAKLKLIAAGDILFHLPQVWAANTETGYDFSPAFKYVKTYIEGADIAIANFETVTAGNDLEFTGFPRFNSPEESILGIKESGFDILSTINNHSLDRNKHGIINTINIINKYGLKNIGTYKTPDRLQLIEDINGIKIAFIGYTFSLNGLDSLLKDDEEFMVNKLDEALIKADIDYLNLNNVDIIIAYLHWGNEYQKEPTIYQSELANKMIEWGTDIILGSHPHIIQRSDCIEYEGDKKLVVYSMGNFLSNQRYETMGNSLTEDGLLVEIDIEKDLSSSKTTILNVQYIPTWVYRYKDINGMQYEILPIEYVLENTDKFNLPEDILNRIVKSYNDTLSTLNPKSK